MVSKSSGMLFLLYKMVTLIKNHLQRKMLRCGTGIRTCTSFCMQKSTFGNGMSSIPENFLSQMMRFEWPVIDWSFMVHDK